MTLVHVARERVLGDVSPLAHRTQEGDPLTQVCIAVVSAHGGLVPQELGRLAQEAEVARIRSDHVLGRERGLVLCRQGRI